MQVKVPLVLIKNYFPRHDRIVTCRGKWFWQIENILNAIEPKDCKGRQSGDCHPLRRSLKTTPSRGLETEENIYSLFPTKEQLDY